MVKNLPVMQETQVRSLDWEDPLEKEMATHSSTLALKIPWTEEPGVHGVAESDTTERLHFLSFFPGGSDGKKSACNARDLDSIPGSGRSPGGGNGNPLQHTCLENSMVRGVQKAAVQQESQS